MNPTIVRISLIGTATVLIAMTSVAFSGELVIGGALAPPPLLASPPQANPDAVQYPGNHAYTGHNLFGSFDGIQKLDHALDVLTVDESSQVRTMQQHGDLLGAQKLLLHGIARYLGITFGSAPLGTVATLAGYYIAIAGDCDFPTAPIEASLDKVLKGGDIAPSEAARYKSVMIQSRLALAGAGTVLGCFEAKRQIDVALQEEATQ